VLQANAMADTEARIATLEKDYERLKGKPKDWWDKAQIIGAMLIPLSIGLAGFWYNQASQRMALENTRRVETQQKEFAALQARISQAQLISTFMDALSSGSRQKKLLAIEAVQYALPEESSRLLQIVSLDSAEPTVQRAARTVLDSRLSPLIADCFSDNSDRNRKAVAELIRVWSNDDKLVEDLIDTASTQTSNRSGVINALTILESINPSLLMSHEAKVLMFLHTVRSNNTDTEAHVANVEGRLKSLLRQQIASLVAQIRDQGQKDAAALKMYDTTRRNAQRDDLVEKFGKTPAEAASIVDSSPTSRSAMAEAIQAAKDGGFMLFRPQIRNLLTYIDNPWLDTGADFVAIRREIETDCFTNPLHMGSCSGALERLSNALN
jgi:hypothetical protein